MPTGTKLVNWVDPASDQKLLLAIIKHSEISKKYDAIAADFGPGIPASCIMKRITKLKQMARDGKAPTTTVKVKKTTGALMSGLKPTSRAKKGKKAKETSDGDESDDEGNDDSSKSGHENTQAMTPPKTPNAERVIAGRVSKRVSPRKSTTKDYKKLEDPFVDMETVQDENGDNIFGGQGRTEEEEEDSDPSDEEYGRKKSVKLEEI